MSPLATLIFSLLPNSKPGLSAISAGFRDSIGGWGCAREVHSRRKKSAIRIRKGNSQTPGTLFRPRDRSFGTSNFEMNKIRSVSGLGCDSSAGFFRHPVYAATREYRGTMGSRMD
ncbi:hypothetical protein KM043_006420 [Ampulex compressa]|nr:hypothetical protein KM043_006420 [Ampulex compressa]